MEKELGEKIVRIKSTYKLTELENWSMDTWCGGPFISGLPSYLRKKLLLNLSRSSR